MTTNGANLLLSEANQKFINSKDKQMRVGPTFKYMFTASVRPKPVKIWNWGKEEKKSKEFIYELILIDHEELEMGDIAKQKEIRNHSRKYFNEFVLYIAGPRFVSWWLIH